MKKNIQILLASLVAAAVVLAPTAGIAQDKPKTPPSGSNAQGKGPEARPIPFRGTVDAVDAAAKTVTVGKLVVHVSSETKLVKNGQPATVENITVGEAITGNYTKGDDGKLTAKTMRVIPKAPGGTEGNRPAKEKAGNKSGVTAE